MGLKDIAKSGMLGVGPALVADNPKLLQGMGLIGNVAYNKIENREDDKRMAAEKEAQAKAEMAKEQKAAAAMNNYRSAVSKPSGGLEGYKALKNGGKVKSASSRADGCAIRGRTKA
jgi:hypothetical protein